MPVEGHTFPELARKLGVAKGTLEVRLAKYAAELPRPVMLGHSRVYPPVTLRLLQDLLRREQEAKVGA